MSTLTPDLLALVLVLAMALIFRSRREALEHRDAQSTTQSAKQRLVTQCDAARHQTRATAKLHDSVDHVLTAIIALPEGVQGTDGGPRTDEVIDMVNALTREGLTDTWRAATSLQATPGPSPDNVAETIDPLAGRVLEGPQSISGAAGQDWPNNLLTMVRVTDINAVLTETGRRPLSASYSQALEEVVCVVVWEALINVMHHAEDATYVVISLDRDQAATRITVSSGGRAVQPGRTDGSPGSPQAPTVVGCGLANPAAAVGEHGGTLSAGPIADEGTSG